MLDSDLAVLYGVEARALNQAVKRNRHRFPEDFMFQLTANEAEGLRSVLKSQIVTSSSTGRSNSSQFVMSSPKHRGRAYHPYAFTEQGVAMLSSVLRSPRAVEINIAIMRTFVQLRRLMDSNRELARKVETLEKKYIRICFGLRHSRFRVPSHMAELLADAPGRAWMIACASTFGKVKIGNKLAGLPQNCSFAS